MDYKIIKQTNPLGGVKYFPKVKIRFLWVIPVWRYVYYSSYSEEVELRDYEQDYPTLETAKQAVEKYWKWKALDFKFETIY
jgi:hypothetical protein